ncbi:MAG: ERCC4 domain-containing protein [Desulfobacterales bacterium]|nr:ERCC4 domain-containing protein [Desulfobacterales bacterium]
MHPQPIIITIDDRERSSGVPQALAAMDKVTAVIRRLPLGDYEVDGRLLIERKTLPDFAVSVIDSRLFRQMTRLAMSPYKGVLILEGRSRDLLKTGIRREALQGALITTSLVLGIPVLRSFNPGETARLIIFAARQLKFAAAGGLTRSGYRPKGRRKRQLYILQSLPGVGPARAARLLDHFGSVWKVLNASVESIAGVEGIGPETARGIQQIVREPLATYGMRTDLLTDL